VKLDWTHSADEFDALLVRWRGARAEAWSYSVSHGVFYLALHRPPGVAYIQFKDCQSIHLYRTSWEPSDLVVSRVPHRLGTLHTVIDPGNFHVVCWAAFGAESDRRVSLSELTGDA
jgi:hypothetical protein